MFFAPINKHHLRFDKTETTTSRENRRERERERERDKQDLREKMRDYVQKLPPLTSEKLATEMR
jgi:hypothetical protein